MNLNHLDKDELESRLYATSPGTLFHELALAAVEADEGSEEERIICGKEIDELYEKIREMELCRDELKFALQDIEGWRPVLKSKAEYRQVIGEMQRRAAKALLTIQLDRA